MLEALLAALAVSLVVNDTPTDVAGWGALSALVLWAWARSDESASSGLSRLAPECAASHRSSGSRSCSPAAAESKTVLPTAETVIGAVPTTTTTATARSGDPKAGAVLFTSQGCGGCHTFKPAGTNGNIGPDLDKLPEYAKTADQPLDAFTHESIANPSAYVEKGYQPTMPNFGQTLSAKQISDLVAYLTQKG